MDVSKSGQLSGKDTTVKTSRRPLVSVEKINNGATHQSSTVRSASPSTISRPRRSPSPSPNTKTSNTILSVPPKRSLSAERRRPVTQATPSLAATQVYDSKKVAGARLPESVWPSTVRSPHVSFQFDKLSRPDKKPVGMFSNVVHKPDGKTLLVSQNHTTERKRVTDKSEDSKPIDELQTSTSGNVSSHALINSNNDISNTTFDPAFYKGMPRSVVLDRLKNYKATEGLHARSLDQRRRPSSITSKVSLNPLAKSTDTVDERPRASNEFNLGMVVSSLKEMSVDGIEGQEFEVHSVDYNSLQKPIVGASSSCPVSPNKTSSPSSVFCDTLSQMSESHLDRLDNTKEKPETDLSSVDLFGGSVMSSIDDNPLRVPRISSSSCPTSPEKTFLSPSSVCSLSPSRMKTNPALFKGIHPYLTRNFFGRGYSGVRKSGDTDQTVNTGLAKGLHSWHLEPHKWPKSRVVKVSSCSSTKRTDVVGNVDGDLDMPDMITGEKRMPLPDFGSTSLEKPISDSMSVASLDGNEGDKFELRAFDDSLLNFVSSSSSPISPDKYSFSPSSVSSVSPTQTGLINPISTTCINSFEKNAFICSSNTRESQTSSKENRGVSPTPLRTNRGVSLTPSRTTRGVSSTPSRTTRGVSPTPSRTGVCSTPSKIARGVSPTPSHTTSVVSPTPSQTTRGVSLTPTRATRGVSLTPTRASNTLSTRGVSPTPTKATRGVSVTPGVSNVASTKDVNPTPTTGGLNLTPTRVSNVVSIKEFDSTATTTMMTRGVSPTPLMETRGVNPTPTPTMATRGVSPTPTMKTRGVSPTPTTVSNVISIPATVASSEVSGPTQTRESIGLTTTPTMTTKENSIGPTMVTRGVSPTPKYTNRGVSLTPTTTTRGVSPSPIMTTKGVSASPSVESRGLGSTPTMATRGVSLAPTMATRGVSSTHTKETRGVSSTPNTAGNGVSLTPTVATRGVSSTPKRETRGISPSPAKISNVASTRGVSSTPTRATRGVSPSPSMTSDASSPRGVSVTPRTLTPVSTRGISPSRIRNWDAPDPPTRGVSPTPFRPASPSKESLSSTSHLSSTVDIKKGNKGANHIEDVHQLRLLDNRHLQWRYANARADKLLYKQKVAAERELYGLWRTNSELSNLVTEKRIDIEELRLKLKLFSILDEQITYLKEWTIAENNHTSILSQAIEDLKKATLNLPVIGGAKGNIHSVKPAIVSAVELMQRIGSSTGSILSRVEGVNTLVSELARVATEEIVLLEECEELFSIADDIQAEEYSLRTHLVQLKQAMKGHGH